MRVFSNPFAVFSGPVIESLQSELLGAPVLTLFLRIASAALTARGSAVFSSLALLSEFIPKEGNLFHRVELELLPLLIAHCRDSEIQCVL